MHEEMDEIVEGGHIRLPAFTLTLEDHSGNKRGHIVMERYSPSIDHATDTLPVHAYSLHTDSTAVFRPCKFECSWSQFQDLGQP